MHTRPFGCWSMRISRWTQQHDWPLWVRAADRVDVPAAAWCPAHPTSLRSWHRPALRWLSGRVCVGGRLGEGAAERRQALSALGG